MYLSEVGGTALFKLTAVCYYVSSSARKGGLGYRNDWLVANTLEHPSLGRSALKLAQRV